MGFSDILGNIGVFCFLYAYYLLQRGKIKYTELPYLGMNLAGSLLLMFSLLFSWNMPAFLLEAAWAIISIYGMYKHLYLPRRIAS